MSDLPTLDERPVGGRPLAGRPLDESPVDARPSASRVALAWGVHLFTASGAVVGVAALLALGDGRLALAGIGMLVALFIDSVDGSLARAVGVSTVLPSFDGRRLDDMVDFFNYVLVPAVFLVVAGSLLHPVVAAAPILASAYGFSQSAAKTDDHFFLGFPSYWNVLALYLWLLEIPPLVGTCLTLALSIGVFVPLKYIYPSQLTVLFRTTLALSALWLLAMTWCVLDPARARDSFAIELSLAYPAYYIVLSAVLGRWHRPARKRGSR